MWVGPKKLFEPDLNPTLVHSTIDVIQLRQITRCGPAQPQHVLFIIWPNYGGCDEVKEYEPI